MEIIITGTGSGIGEALSKYFLSLGNRVIGISRKNTIDHPNFVFIEKDLLKISQFDWLLPYVTFESELMVINNAGSIGAIERISEQDHSDIDHVMTLNAIRPMQLCQFVLKNQPLDLPLTLVNISSGAGKRPVASWASYCSSKAAIDLFSQTIALEEMERGRKLKVYSVAPGVVDTPMQQTIRSVDKKLFSDVEKFQSLHTNGELLSLSDLVKKFQFLLDAPYNGNVVQTLRDY